MAKSLNDILDELAEESEDEGQLSVGGVLELFEGRTFGPLILALGLIAITPIGAIPFVPTIIGA